MRRIEAPEGVSVFSDCSSTVSKNTRTSSVILIPLDACVDGVDGRRVPEGCAGCLLHTPPCVNNNPSAVSGSGKWCSRVYKTDGSPNTGVEVLRTDFKNQAASQPGAASFLCVLLQLQVIRCNYLKKKKNIFPTFSVCLSDLSHTHINIYKHFCCTMLYKW